MGEVSPANKPTLSVPSVPRIPNKGLGTVGPGAMVQRQQIRTGGQMIQNLAPSRAVSPVYTPTPVSPPQHSTMRGLTICNNRLPVRHHSSQTRNNNPAIHNHYPPN